MNEKTYRIRKFEQVVLSPNVDIKALRSLSWNGTPPAHRALTWKLLLGYLPANLHRRASTLERKRREYTTFSSLHTTTMMSHDLEVLKQIQADIPRTAPHLGLFRDGRIQLCLERLLFTWAMRHPASSYVQGMNDLVVPLFVVFLGSYHEDVDNMNDLNHISDTTMAEIEADSYWCLSSVLSEIQDHYTPDQPGIQRMTHRLEALLERLDMDLWSHLKEREIQISHFAFRWMNCLFVRELPLPSLIRVWDTYLSEDNRGFDTFHVYVCAALMQHFSNELKKMEFEDLFYFLQNLPTQKWQEREVEVLLGQAFIWRSSMEEFLERVLKSEREQVKKVNSKPSESCHQTSINETALLTANMMGNLNVISLSALGDDFLCY